MSSEIKSIGRHTLIYGAGVVISKMASFLMLPIYTRYLTPADYGTLELLSMTIDVIGTIAGIGLAASVFKFYADYDEPSAKDEVVSTAAISVCALSAVTALLGLLAAPALGRWVLQDANAGLYFRLFFVIYFVQSCEAIPLLLIRALHQSKLFVTLSIAKLVAMLALNIYFVVVLRIGVTGVLLSNLIVTGVSAVGLTLYLFRKVGIGFSREKFRTMARFGYPVMFVYVGNFVLVFSDRYFLNHFAGTDAVGIYSLAYKFAFILSAFAFNPFQMVWAPQRFAIAKRPDAQAIYTRVFLYLNLALGAIAGGIALFARDLLVVMADPAFFSAHEVIAVLLVAQIVHHWTAYCNLGLYLKNRTGQFAWSSMIGVVAVLLLNAILIPRYGIHGAAWATLGAYGLRFIGVYALSQRHYAIDYGWSGIVKLYAILASAIATRDLLGDLPVPASIAIGTTLAVLVAAAVYRFILDREDQSRVRALVLRPRSILTLRA